MTDPKAKVIEINLQAQALSRWFESQGMTATDAVKCMGYLLGTMAADAATSVEDGFEKLEVVNLLAMAQCVQAYAVKHSRS